MKFVCRYCGDDAEGNIRAWYKIYESQIITDIELNGNDELYFEYDGNYDSGDCGPDEEYRCLSCGDCAPTLEELIEQVDGEEQ